MKILVTGGAGYIGSVCVKELVAQKHNVVVVDNLSKGKKELVAQEAEFIQADLTQRDKLFEIFSQHSFDAVIHFAGYKAVEESMSNAVMYSANITGTIHLLDAMVKHNVSKIIFSSSAAVYGVPKENIVNEESPTQPINYYGYTKLAGEQLIAWYSQIHNITGICLRYFNVAGDAGLLYVDPQAKNILPIIMEVVFNKRKELTLFGNDYATPDGTCVRDYIDVRDLVQAHILALRSEQSNTINIGSGRGYSVLELVEAVEKIIHKKLPIKIGPRRKGDPAHLTAQTTRAKKELEWEPKQHLDSMIQSTYKAYRKRFCE